MVRAFSVGCLLFLYCKVFLTTVRQRSGYSATLCLKNPNVIAQT